VYESNYTSGLRILDISDIANANLAQLAFFDTYPTNDDAVFEGTWSNYPFFPSGVIAVSDITNGLFLLKPHYEAFITQHPEDKSVCIGDQLELPIEVIGENLTYQWQINTGAGFEDITDNVAYNNMTTKILHFNVVKLTQNQYQYRCEITTPNEIYYTNSAMLEVLYNTIAGFDFTTDNNKVNFSNTSYAATTYLWDFGDESATDNSESPQHTYAYEAMDYTVTLTASNNCSSNDSTKIINIVITGLDLKNPNNDLKLYPIPASRQITIESNLIKDNSIFTIYTNEGKAVLNGTLAKGSKTINISKLNKGVYFIKFNFEKDGMFTQRIVIE